MDSLSVYFTQMARLSLPQDMKTQQRLCQEAQAGNEDAFRTMVEKNLRLVVYAVKPFRHLMPLEDLIQEGNILLMRAIRLYQPKKKVKFSTYACACVQKGLLKKITAYRSTIPIPDGVRTLLRRFHQVSDLLMQSRKRHVTREEVFRRMRVSDRERQTLLDVFPLQVIAWNSAPEEGLTPEESYTDDRTFQRVIDQEMTASEVQRIARYFDRLPPRVAQAMTYYYGLEDGQMKTYPEVAKYLHISKERSRQLIVNGVYRLRYYLIRERRQTTLQEAGYAN